MRQSARNNLAKNRHFDRPRDLKAAETLWYDEGGVHFVERECTKKRHKTYAAAMVHVRLLIEHGAKRGQIRPYLCKMCKFYHVGHSS